MVCQNLLKLDVHVSLVFSNPGDNHVCSYIAHLLFIIQYIVPIHFWVGAAACDPNVHLYEEGQLVEHAVSQLAVGRTCPAGVAFCCQGVKSNKGERGMY